MEGLKIVGLCVITAVVYGILHDLVTVNICVEYFSIFHPQIFNTDSPWLLALGWGVIATWWMGLFLGPLIAAAARSGELPKLSWRDLVRPLGVLVATSWSCAFIAGLIGYFAVQNIPEWVFETVPRMGEANLSAAKERAFTADLFAHNTSYFATGIGAFVLCGWLIRKRMKMHRPLIAGQRPI